jgi:hypothetical protein
VSPVRYRDLFEKQKRKRDGQILKWKSDKPEPMIDLFYPGYFKPEVYYTAKLLGKLEALERQAAQPAVDPVPGAVTTTMPGPDLMPEHP